MVQKATDFITPAKEFELHRYRLDETNLELRAHSAEIILVLDGTVTLQASNQTETVKKGEAIFVIANTSYSLSAPSAEVFRAASPASQAL